MIGIALMAWLIVPARAALVDVQSPAMQQLQDVDASATSAAADSSPENAKDQGGLGFEIKSIKPIGYQKAPGSADSQDTQAPKTARQSQAPSSSNIGKCYNFTGNSAMKGVTIYSPQEDPTCKAHTAEPPPKEGPISKKMIYGSLGVGAAAVAAGFLLWPPLLLIGGLLLGAGAVLWYINKKLS